MPVIKRFIDIVGSGIRRSGRGIVLTKLPHVKHSSKHYKRHHSGGDIVKTLTSAIPSKIISSSLSALNLLPSKRKVRLIV